MRREEIVSSSMPLLVLLVLHLFGVTVQNAVAHPVSRGQDSHEGEGAIRNTGKLVFVTSEATSDTAGKSIDSGWKSLSMDQCSRDWRGPRQGWVEGSDASIDGIEDRAMHALPGRGVLVSLGPKGGNLQTCEEFVDVELSLDFMIARRSNSGVKLNGMYEIQLLDSAGVEKPLGNDCGGIYPRGEQLPKYHVIDDGYPPSSNAALPAGQWQSLFIAFRSPRFDEEGNRVSKAEFVRVVLNGVEIHKNVELSYPTGSAWRLVNEVPRGPVLLQGDHGGVAFRNVRVRPLQASR